MIAAGVLCGLLLWTAAQSPGVVVSPQSGSVVSLTAMPRPVVTRHVDGQFGLDSNPGTSAAPWRTIQKAANSAPAGCTVWIAAGNYPERVVFTVSGNAAAGPIVFRGAPGGGTVVDGSGFGNAHFSSWSGAFGKGLIDITDCSHLRLQDLEIIGPSTGSTQHFLMGVHVAKTQADPNPMGGIELVRLNVHDVAYTGSSGYGGAQGIAFYGGSTTQAITDVLIQECEVHHLRLGQSESVTLNGNIDGFLIESNFIHDNDNIGLVCIGWEGTAGGSHSEDSSDANAHLYGGHHPLDRARNGQIVGNTVSRCSTDAPVRNPTYPLHDFSAAGIYIDGAASVVIERNAVDECDIGIELGCEHGGVDLLGNPRGAEDVVVRDNIVSYCGQFGIGIGGYNAYRGTVTGSRILNNTIFKCSSLSWGGGQLHVGKCHGNLFANNILVARGLSDTVDYDGYANSGWDWLYDLGVVLGSAVGPTHNHSNVLDSNLYYTENGAANLYWKWQAADSAPLQQGFSGLAALDGNGLFGDPLFVLPSSGRTQGNEDLRLSGPGSPAVDSGDTGLGDLGALDFAGLMRVFGVAVDRGAHEWSGGR